jgi:hypothetical protein
MTDIATLQSLLDRVVSGTGADRELDAAIFDAFDNKVPEQPAWPFAPGSNWDKAVPRFTTSLDADVALIERCGRQLHEIDRAFWSERNAWFARVSFAREPTKGPGHAEMPRALLAALLQSLINGARND